MNNGFFGFPSSNYGTSVISVTEFDSSGTYIIPNGAKRLWIMLIGGGGGGGSGARLGAGTNTYGGGGGAGGTINTGYYFVNAIGASLESNAAANQGFTPGSWARSIVITIGAGGDAGTAITADNTNGNPGGAGNPSTLTLSGTPGFMMYSSGGGAGSGGTNASGSPGSGQQMLINGIPVAVTYLTSGAGSFNGNGLSFTINQYTNTGGVGGGGLNTSNVPGDGGSLNQSSSTALAAINNPFIARGLTIKSGGLASTATSQPFQPSTVAGLYTPGLGGVGGGASATTDANNGEDGYRGGGGGGGGGSRNTFNSGAGGRGGNGYCVIVALGL